MLGPEMRSTGEVMGIDPTFGLAFAKSQIAAGDRLPGGQGVPLARRSDKVLGSEAGRRFVDLGFALVATAGTADALDGRACPVAAAWPRSAKATAPSRRPHHPGRSIS